MVWNLDFISEEDFKKHVRATIMKYGEKLESYDLKRFNSNLIDPIKLIFDKSVYRTSWEEIVNNEIFRKHHCFQSESGTCQCCLTTCMPGTDNNHIICFFNIRNIFLTHFFTCYFPIQNFEKISSTRSSSTASPIILPSSSYAPIRSME